MVAQVAVPLPIGRLPDVRRNKPGDRAGQHDLRGRVIDDLEPGWRSAEGPRFPAHHRKLFGHQRGVTELIDLGELRVLELSRGRHQIQSGDVEDAMILIVSRRKQRDLPDVREVQAGSGGAEIRCRDVNVLPEVGGSGHVAAQRQSRIAELDIHVPGAVGRDRAPFQVQVNGRICSRAQIIESIAAHLEKNIPPSAGRIDGIQYQGLSAAEIVHRQRSVHVAHGGAAALVDRRSPATPVGGILIRIEIPHRRQRQLSGFDLPVVECQPERGEPGNESASEGVPPTGPATSNDFDVKHGIGRASLISNRRVDSLLETALNV